MPYVTTRLGRWFYEERGKVRAGEPAIVLGHSFMCDGGMWRGQIDSLADVGRVINFDLPGHGKSEIPPVFTLEEHASETVSALGQLDIDRAVFIGLSWGGMVAMRIAIQAPQRVAGLALLDTSARRHSLADRLRYRALLPVARWVGLPRVLLEREAVPQMFAPRTVRERRDIVDAFVRTAQGFDRRGIAVAGRAVMTDRTDISESITSIRAKTLVLCGAEDRATPPAEGQLIAARISGARFELLPGCGHLSALEDSAGVARRLRAFVTEVLAPRAKQQAQVS